MDPMGKGPNQVTRFPHVRDSSPLLSYQPRKKRFHEPFWPWFLCVGGQETEVVRRTIFVFWILPTRKRLKIKRVRLMINLYKRWAISWVPTHHPRNKALLREYSPPFGGCPKPSCTVEAMPPLMSSYNVKVVQDHQRRSQGLGLGTWITGKIWKFANWAPSSYK